jgi:hypothetical protein
MDKITAIGCTRLGCGVGKRCRTWSVCGPRQDQARVDLPKRGGWRLHFWELITCTVAYMSPTNPAMAKYCATTNAMSSLMHVAIPRPSSWNAPPHSPSWNTRLGLACAHQRPQLILHKLLLTGTYQSSILISVGSKSEASQPTRFTQISRHGRRKLLSA